MRRGARCVGIKFRKKEGNFCHQLQSKPLHHSRCRKQGRASDVSGLMDLWGRISGLMNLCNVCWAWGYRMSLTCTERKHNLLGIGISRFVYDHDPGLFHGRAFRCRVTPPCACILPRCKDPSDIHAFDQHLDPLFTCLLRDGGY